MYILQRIETGYCNMLSLCVTKVPTEVTPRLACGEKYEHLLKKCPKNSTSI